MPNDSRVRAPSGEGAIKLLMAELGVVCIATALITGLFIFVLPHYARYLDQDGGLTPTVLFAIGPVAAAFVGGRIAAKRSPAKDAWDRAFVAVIAAVVAVLTLGFSLFVLLNVVGA
jgi:hypothetical protein